MILLDTLALIWMAKGHRRARPLKELPRLYLSPATVLELQFLAETGRVRFAGGASPTFLAADERWRLDEPPSGKWFATACHMGWIWLFLRPAARRARPLPRLAAGDGGRSAAGADDGGGRVTAVNATCACGLARFDDARINGPRAWHPFAARRTACEGMIRAAAFRPPTAAAA